jgi:hypothetical protein
VCKLIFLFNEYSVYHCHCADIAASFLFFSDVYFI